MSPEKQASVTNSVFHGKTNSPQALFLSNQVSAPQDVEAQRIETDNLILCGSKTSWPASEMTKYMLAVWKSRHGARLENVAWLSLHDSAFIQWLCFAACQRPPVLGSVSACQDARLLLQGAVPIGLPNFELNQRPAALEAICFALRIQNHYCPYCSH